MSQDRLEPSPKSSEFASIHLSRLPKPVKLFAVALIPIVLAGSLYLGFTHTPDTAPPTSAEAATNIADVFALPEGADEVLQGDYLIERFYILDVETGQRKVGDICKGRVKDIIVTVTGDWSGFDYRIVLDRVGLEAERDRIRAFVAATAPVDPNLGAEYVGLWVQGGIGSAFLLNYTGKLPPTRASFSAPDGGDGDVYSFLLRQEYAEASKGIKVLNVDGTSFLLRSTADSPYYRENFRTQKALLLAELLLVDGTAPSQVSTYREISWSIPGR